MGRREDRVIPHIKDVRDDQSEIIMNARWLAGRTTDPRHLQRLERIITIAEQAILSADELEKIRRSENEIARQMGYPLGRGYYEGTEDQ